MNELHTQLLVKEVSIESNPIWKAAGTERGIRLGVQGTGWDAAYSQSNQLVSLVREPK